MRRLFVSALCRAGDLLFSRRFPAAPVFVGAITTGKIHYKPSYFPAAPVFVGVFTISVSFAARFFYRVTALFIVAERAFTLFCLLRAQTYAALFFAINLSVKIDISAKNGL